MIKQECILTNPFPKLCEVNINNKIPKKILMKIILHFIFTLLFTFSFQAQVGVGTINPQAALDIDSTNDGLLIPRVALTDLNTVTIDTPTESEMVFNTTSNGTVEPGFYYLSHIAGTLTWVRFSGAGWLLNGNDGVTTSNFIGSINEADVIFKRANLSSGRLGLTNTFFGRLAGNANIGSQNTYIGSNAGALLNSTAQNNTAIGFNALQSQNGRNSSENTAIGAKALENASGNNNTAVGNLAGSANTGSNNVIIGNLASITSGNNSVTIGSGASSGAAQSSVAIGSNARSEFTSSVAIGFGATTTAVGEMRLGSAAITSVVTSGTVTASSFISNATTYPDYVFEDYFYGVSKIKSDYKFNTLEEAEAFVIKNGHLPGVKSYAEIMENGYKLDLTDATITNLEKLEEQFLYITEINKKIKTQQNTIQTQEVKIKSLEARLERLETFLKE